MRNKKQRIITLLTFIFATLGVGLLSASLGTDFWVVAHPQRQVDQNLKDSARNLTGNIGTKFEGTINFGLFHGYRVFDHGLGNKGREEEVWTACEESANVCGWSENSDRAKAKKDIKKALQDYEKRRAATKYNASVSETVKDHGLFNFGLWVTTIIFLAFGVVWGLVSMGFAVLNMATRPIETITGPVGLYVWNSFACLFSLLSIIMYVVLYYKDLKHNVLTQDKRDNFWTSKDRAYFGFSFWLVTGATLCYSINIIFVAASGIHLKPLRYTANVNEKAMDGVMMY